MENIKSQDIEFQLSEKYIPKKKDNLKLSDSYYRIGRFDKAKRCYECGSFLGFVLYNDGRFKLKNANFCKDRLCPTCSWRRSKKIYSQVSKILDVIENDFSFIMVTLTQRNCSKFELSEMVSKINYAITYGLMRDKRFKSAVKGGFKALEITRNINNSCDLEYHPHVHCIFAVNKSYFDDKSYISQKEWVSFWRKHMKLDYNPQVDVRKIKNLHIDDKKGMRKAVLEVSKYTVKSDDYLNFDDFNIIDDGVEVFMKALYNRRLCSFFGIFKVVAQNLKLDDAINGDLVNVNDDNLTDEEYVLLWYKYHVGVGYTHFRTDNK